MKKFPLATLAILATLLAGCATPPPPHLDTSLTARGQSSRVKFIILHYTVADLQRSIKILTEQEVSAHYLLTDTDEPKFYALVDENRMSHHAGVSSWKNFSNLNPASIGIEIVNAGYTDTPQGRVYAPFKQAQMDQLIPLLKQIAARHQVPPQNILGHADIAPQRKQDPGPRFPWRQLADAGLIPWPDAGQVMAQRSLFDVQLPDMFWFQKKLAEHGYAVPQTGVLDEATRNVLFVFQSKYRQSKYDGEPDAETAAILDVLTRPASPPAPQPSPAPVPVPVTVQ
ncbi:N-acetylmuramoyl-L-alanine amidase [Pseudoduganella namucuonensis]|uniref:N-acetylmuramoyl-L-alanine amidase n=1 Tax=Pseudoduganella namucuonensis TaxID=1035707 RepID=A0A1I7M769_9BURK|nr:N-acetylmuramoyl-L-alanine amidase [Pseudoduganella namucuonensis]SFV17763.1 N-acetylmuramoyl-L-alanine amidase [Pseudoduganella namucuonensis]